MQRVLGLLRLWALPSSQPNVFSLNLPLADKAMQPTETFPSIIQPYACKPSYFTVWFAIRAPVRVMYWCAKLYCSSLISTMF